MSASRPDDALPPEVDARLSQLLARWAAHRRLAPAQADAIRQAILSSPGELGYDWWRALLRQVTGVVVEAQGRSGSIQTALSAIAWSLRRSMPDCSGPAGHPTTYRLYLRLT